MGLRDARKAKGWNQQCAARQLGVSQAYLSLLETGRRRPSARLSARLTRVFHLPATVVPAGAFRSMGADELVSDLAVLGYPGFQHFHRNTPLKNPAEVLLGALELLAHAAEQPDLRGSGPQADAVYLGDIWEVFPFGKIAGAYEADVDTGIILDAGIN